jgi:hypothetical protein
MLKILLSCAWNHCGGEPPREDNQNIGIRKVGAMIHIKMNFKSFLLPLLRIISLPHNFSTFPPFLSLRQTLWDCNE